MVDREKVAELHRQGLTQREIAARAGCTQGYVAQILRGMGATHGRGSRWVSVRDGMPGHPHEVLVTVSNPARRHGFRYISIARYDRRWILRGGARGTVVAWMELPEEYKG